MDFFLKRSLSCLLLSFNSQLIKGPEWYRQIPLSCLLWQYQIKNSVAERYLIRSFECQCQALYPRQHTKAARMCLRNTTHKSNLNVATSSFLQFPEEKKKKRKADVLCFVFPSFGQKWRSFTASSIDWPRADFRFLRIVKTMSVHNSYQACYRPFNQLPAIACWVTQGFILWQTASPWWL